MAPRCSRGLPHQGESQAGGAQAWRPGDRQEQPASGEVADEQVQEDREEEAPGGRGEESPGGEEEVAGTKPDSSSCTTNHPSCSKSLGSSASTETGGSLDFSTCLKRRGSGSRLEPRGQVAQRGTQSGRLVHNATEASGSVYRLCEDEDGLHLWNPPLQDHLAIEAARHTRHGRRRHLGG